LSLLIKLKWYKTATFLHKQSIKRISLSLTLNGDVHNKDGKVTGFMNYSVLFVVSFFFYYNLKSEALNTTADLRFCLLLQI